LVAFFKLVSSFDHMIFVDVIPSSSRKAHCLPEKA